MFDAWRLMLENLQDLSIKNKPKDACVSRTAKTCGRPVCVFPTTECLMFFVAHSKMFLPIATAISECSKMCEDG